MRPLKQVGEDGRADKDGDVSHDDEEVLHKLQQDELEEGRLAGDEVEGLLEQACAREGVVWGGVVWVER